VAVVIDLRQQDRRISGTGTAEADWSRWPGWTTGRPVTVAELLPGNGRLVVLAPHPDDETLAAGGLIHDAAEAGREVVIVAVTSGEASHPGTERWAALASQRRAERAAALVELGVGRPLVYELGIPDGAVSACIDKVISSLRAIVTPSDVLVGPWRFDGHPDHEATAEAVRACSPTAYEAPIWGWHWARPDGGQLPLDGRLLRLSEPAWQAKHRAVGCFTSQLEPDPSTGAEPILPDWALPRWLRRTEVFFDAR
jgi:LmbE family N-acetylglucosaminyl deacetylase